MKSDTGLDEEGRVNLNTAPRKRLASLPGVSSSTARKIISNRPLHSRDDLLRLGLLTAEAIDSLRPHIVPLPHDAALHTAQRATSNMAEQLVPHGNNNHINNTSHHHHQHHQHHHPKEVMAAVPLGSRPHGDHGGNEQGRGKVAHQAEDDGDGHHRQWNGGRYERDASSATETLPRSGGRSPAHPPPPAVDINSDPPELVASLMVAKEDTLRRFTAWVLSHRPLADRELLLCAPGVTHQRLRIVRARTTELASEPGNRRGEEAELRALLSRGPAAISGPRRSDHRRLRVKQGLSVYDGKLGKVVVGSWKLASLGGAARAGEATGGPSGYSRAARVIRQFDVVSLQALRSPSVAARLANRLRGWRYVVSGPIPRKSFSAPPQHYAVFWRPDVVRLAARPVTLFDGSDPHSHAPFVTYFSRVGGDFEPGLDMVIVSVQASANHPPAAGAGANGNPNANDSLNNNNNNNNNNNSSNNNNNLDSSPGRGGHNGTDPAGGGLIDPSTPNGGGGTPSNGSNNHNHNHNISNLNATATSGGGGGDAMGDAGGGGGHESVSSFPRGAAAATLASTITMVKQFCSREETLVIAGDLGVPTDLAKQLDGWRPLLVTPMPTTFGTRRRHRGVCRDNLWMPSRGMESAGFTGECGVLSYQRFLFENSDRGRAEAMATVTDSKPVWAAFYRNSLEFPPGEDRAEDVARYAAKKKLPPIKRIRRRDILAGLPDDINDDDSDDTSSYSSDSSNSSGSSGSSDDDDDDDDEDDDDDDDDEDTYNQSMSMSRSFSSSTASVSSRGGPPPAPYALAMIYNRDEVDRAADDLLEQHRRAMSEGGAGGGGGGQHGGKDRCVVM